MKHLKSYNENNNIEPLDIKFIKQPKKNIDSKTDIFFVYKNEILIGQVKWSSRLRGYGFLPTSDCESTVKDFIKDLMLQRRSKLI